MDNDAQFDQLARRDTELSALASRGRRRSLLIMILAFIPIPFVLMAINNDHDLAGVIPLGLAFVGGMSYSWAKWQRRPEDSQSVAFVGLDRKRRGATYRSMLGRRRIDDPVVLTIVESIHHLRRTLVAVVATIVLIAASTLALIAASEDGVTPWLAAAILVLAAGAIAAHRWIINRSGWVIEPSHR
jgi:uncharacterized membrane protein